MTRAEPSLGRVTIVGLGLIGGSVARGLAERGGATHLTGWSPDASEREAARAAGAVDATPDDVREEVSRSDLVVLAAPLGATLDLVGEMASALPERSTLTDVASLKRPVLEAVRAAGASGRWVGSHPMAGSAASGFAASRADLFDGATIWTVQEGAGEGPGATVDTLWRVLGGRPSRIDADEHDRLMGTVSHLPQLTANALAEVMEAWGVGVDQLGRGGRDMTRLAGSSPEMWGDLLAHAPSSLPDGLRDVAAAVVRLADLVESGEIESACQVMGRTRSWRGSS